MQSPPTLWQKAKAFISAPFWEGLVKGGLVGVPTALVVYSLFALIPAAILPAAMAGFTTLPVQFLFCTVFGGASAAVAGGLQAVASLNEPSGPTPAAPFPARSPALDPQDLSDLRDASPILQNDRIKAILAAGPQASHRHALAATPPTDLAIH